MKPQAGIFVIADELLYDCHPTTGAARMLLEFLRKIPAGVPLAVIGANLTGAFTWVTQNQIAFHFTSKGVAPQLEMLRSVTSSHSSCHLLTLTDRGLEIAATFRYEENRYISITHWQHYSEAAYTPDSGLIRHVSSVSNVVFPTNWEANQFRSTQSGRHIGVHVIPNRIHDISSLRSEPENHLIFVGRRSFEKGYDVWLRMACVLRTIDKNLHFVSVGAEDDDASHALASDRGMLLASGVLTEYDILPQRDIWKLIASARLLVLPSRRDCYPVCILEAASLGVRAITSALPNLVEVASQCENVTTVSGWSPRAFAAAVLEKEVKKLRKQTARSQSEPSNILDIIVSHDKAEKCGR